MTDLLSFQNFGNLAMLIFLQAVLGFDNLLYISIESKRAPEDMQSKVRKMGILIAVALRIILLFTMIQLLAALTTPWFHLDWKGVIEGDFTFAVIVFLFGGVFIMYTAVKEISHMLRIDDLVHEGEGQSKKSAKAVIALIVFMNLIFSFDSILSAMALSDVFWVMATAIIISGGLMIWLSDGVSTFLAKNRMYEVLGLFILFLVGVMLLSEGGHLAHLELFENHITPMSKTTFYFVIFILVVIEIVQGKYQKKLLRKRPGGH